MLFCISFILFIGSSTLLYLLTKDLFICFLVGSYLFFSTWDITLEHKLEGNEFVYRKRRLPINKVTTIEDCGDYLHVSGDFGGVPKIRVKSKYLGEITKLYPKVKVLDVESDMPFRVIKLIGLYILKTLVAVVVLGVIYKGGNT